MFVPLFLLLVSSPELVSPPGGPDGLWDKARESSVRAEHLRSQGRSAGSEYQVLASLLKEIRHQGHTTSQVCINEGHAAYLGGDLPHALLCYLLAQRLEPTNRELASLIDQVRGQLGVEKSTRGIAAMTFGLLATNLRLRVALWFTALVTYTAGWCLLAISFRCARKSVVLASSILILASILMGTALLGSASVARQDSDRSLVIVARTQPAGARAGNGYSYPALGIAEIKAGSEARLLSQRGSWFQMEFSDGTAGWLPASAIEVE